MNSTRASAEKMLANFLDGDRLKVIPAKASRRRLVAQWLAEHFELDRTYTESEVNAIIRRHHDDFATLRREIIDNRFMTRDEGIYRRAAPGKL